MNWNMIFEFLIAVVGSISIVLMTRQITIKGQIEKQKQEADAREREHKREMQELRNEWEREKAQFEQHRAVSNILQLTIEKNSEVQSDVASAIRDSNTVQRSVEQTMITLRDNFETVMLAFGNVAETSKRAETASVQTLQVVTEKTERIENRIKTVEKELADIRETQELYVEKQGERHTAIQKQLNEKFTKLTDDITALKADVSDIREFLKPIPPKPPLTLPQTETTEDPAA